MDDILAMEIGGADIKYVYYSEEETEFNVIPYTLGKDKRERFLNALSRVHSLYSTSNNLAIVSTFPVGAKKLSDDMKMMLLTLRRFSAENKWLLGGNGELYPFNTDSECQKIIANTPVFVGASYVGFPLFCRNMEIQEHGIFVEMGSASTNLSSMINGVVDYTDTRRPFFYGMAWFGTFFTDLEQICATVPYAQYIVPTVPRVLKSMHLLYFLHPENTNNLLFKYNLPALKKEDVISHFATFINMDIEHIDENALALTAEYLYNTFIFSLGEWIYRFRCYKEVGSPIICGGIGKHMVVEALKTCKTVVDIGDYTERWHIVDLLGLLSEVVRKLGHNPKELLEEIQ